MSVDNTSSKHWHSPDSESEGNTLDTESDAVVQKTPAKRRKPATEGSEGSPKSRTCVSPSSAQGSPKITKKALAEAEKAKKNHQKESLGSMKIGWKVVQYTDAKNHFRFSDQEMGTLPYVTFENQNNPSRPGKSYNKLDLLRLAYRKEAALNGVEGALDGVPNDSMLKEGQRLFDARMDDLDSKYKKNHGGKSRPVLRTFSIIQRRSYSPEPIRPFGAWWERVWEDGRMIGWWLVYHFDPEAECGGGNDDDGDYYRSLDKRFWPVEKGCPSW
ncbi:uncharacterized protein EV420DRAFT_1729064 [Desarmillaria tabescens]|uniref:Uncharacterized protein n=1 Tax=Armillaria tabescens TaxID=1929756 RepID=A0AA39TM07_ARMTA|nr:uncharacterized protein EV420DRAFT_1729064 [Desarmillaria tabescens]KAK0463722.1 hypothetical protein EV420DRAFT_1729064 [Desarmillaria tabescens]